MMAHQFKEPTPVRELNPEVPAGLAEVIERLMKKAPEARYASAGEVVEALRQHAGGAAPRPAARPQAARESARARTAAPTQHELAAVPEPKGRSVSPSAPTPRPYGQVSLPSRNTIRGGAAGHAQADEQEEAAARQAHAHYEEPRRGDEKFSPLVLGAIAVAACVLGLAAALYLF
jgi:serine/threonine-protein kinase